MRFFLVIIGIISAFSVNVVLADDIEWLHDGAVSTNGCNVIGGQVLSYETKQCLYRDKTFQIIDNKGVVCGSAMTEWKDPETGQVFTYTTTCDHPKFCDEDGGSNSSHDQYIDQAFLSDIYFGELVKFHARFLGNVCYGMIDFSYSEQDNKIDITVDGQWSNAVLAVSIPPQLHTDTMEVLIDGTPADFSVKKSFKENSLVRENSELRIILPHSNTPQHVLILPHQIIDPYTVKVSDKEFEKSSKILPPKKQIQSGIPYEEILCKQNLVLVQKYDGMLACVTESTKTKLIERGWAKDTIEYPAKIDVDFTRIIDANNQFALDYYSQISSNHTHSNVFFSPWSISSAFAIVYEGARNHTAEEIRAVFGFPEDDYQRQHGFQSIHKNLTEPNSEFSLNTANSLWIKQGYQVRHDYIDTAETFYFSTVDNADFASNQGINKINSWVSSKTQNKINELFESGSTDELTRLVVANAIYFNGEWVHQFSTHFTVDADFYVTPEKTVTVPMMDIVRHTILNYTKNDSVEILELPYKGDRISMLILLPKEIDGIKSLEKNLTYENLTQWKNNLSETDVLVYLPKFTVNTEYALHDDLQEMGMKIPFDEYDADFGGINDTEQIYIDQAVHKAFVNVNEHGTEAAASTGVELGFASAPSAMFRADHPFVFLIQDHTTDQILFMGRVMDPTQ